MISSIWLAVFFSFWLFVASSNAFWFQSDRSKNLCNLLNAQGDDVPIPIAALIAFPSEERLLLLDHLGMFHEIVGENAVQLSGESVHDFHVQLQETIDVGQWRSRWPMLTSVVANYSEGIVYRDANWFCLLNGTSVNKRHGKCYSFNLPDVMVYEPLKMQSRSNSSEVMDKLNHLVVCRRKSSLLENDQFELNFYNPETFDAQLQKDADLECPFKWGISANGQFNAPIMEYNGLTFILNRRDAFIFKTKQIVENGTATVYRMPLKQLFRCEQKLIIRKKAKYVPAKWPAATNPPPPSFFQNGLFQMNNIIGHLVLLLQLLALIARIYDRCTLFQGKDDEKEDAQSKQD